MQAGRAWQDSLVTARAGLASQAHYLDWYKAHYAQEQGLRQATDARLAIAQRTGRRRGWLLALEGLGLGLLGYAVSR